MEREGGRGPRRPETRTREIRRKWVRIQPMSTSDEPDVHLSVLRFMRFLAEKRARAKKQAGGGRASPLIRSPVSARRVSRRPAVKVRPDFSPLEDPSAAGSFRSTKLASAGFPRAQRNREKIVEDSCGGGGRGRRAESFRCPFGPTRRP